jgi:hypothetical protein
MVTIQEFEQSILGFSILDIYKCPFFISLKNFQTKIFNILKNVENFFLKKSEFLYMVVVKTPLQTSPAAPFPRDAKVRHLRHQT